MVRLYARHQVSDFAKWHQAYEAFDQGARGVQAHAAYQSVDDPNDVTVWHDFASLEDARAFAGSDDLKAAMVEGGVAGAPTIWFTTEA